MPFHCSIYDLFHLTDAVSLEVSFIRAPVTTVVQIVVEITMLPSCLLSPCQQKLHELNPESKKKIYKLSGLYAFGGQEIFFPPLTELFFPIGILRTGFFMFNKNLLNTY